MSETTLEALLAQRRSGAEVVAVDEATVKLVLFALGADLYALPGAAVQEIVADARVYFVPGCAAAIEGVINLRGDIESVLSLAQVLRLAPQAGPPDGQILVTHAGGVRSGLRVDQVVDVMDVPESRLQPVPEALPEALRPFVAHVLQHRAAPVMVLLPERILAALGGEGG